MIGPRALLLATTALLPAAALAQAPNARPEGGRVTAGAAAITRTPSTTTITQSSDRAAIDWRGFDVGRDQTVRFQQPGPGSWTLNRVQGPDPSLIAGRIQANGGVAIVNPSGVVFTGTASVNVGALIASGANITNDDFMAGRMRFEGTPSPGARVENHGQITVRDRGLVALVGPRVGNTGTIRGNLARVTLQGAETFTLDMAGDGMLAIDVTQAVRGGALVENRGTIEAPGGAVTLSAAIASNLVEDVVRQSGRISAPGGQVAIRAPGGGVRVEGRTEAAEVRIGDAATARATVAGRVAAPGGRITVQAREEVTLAATARLDASGAAGGGTVLVGTTGIGRDQRMAARTNVERGARIAADATARGDGGTIAINSAERTGMRGALSARGGAGGGNGGFIEVSGQSGLLIGGEVDLLAPMGRVGTFLIDPRNIIISSDATPSLPGGGTVTPPAVTTPGASFTATTGADNEWLRITPGAINGFAGGNITLTADRSIIIDSDINRTAAGDLVLLAGQGGAPNGADIILRSGVTVTLNGLFSADTQRGAIFLGGEIRSTGLVLNARNAVQQDAGLVRHRDGLATPLPTNAVSAAGVINLAQPGNGALRFSAIDAASTASIQGRSIELAGNLRAEGATLRTTHGVTQSNGTVQHRAGAATELELQLGASTAGGISLPRANGRLSVSGIGTVAGDVTIQGGDRLTVGAALAATGAIDLRAGTLLSIAAPITAGAGQRITLRADDMAITAAVRAPGGEILVQGVSAGRPLFLGVDEGGGDPAGLYLNKEEIGRFQGADGVAAQRLMLEGPVTVGADIALRGRVSTLQLAGQPGYSLDGGAIDVARLVLRATGGDVSAGNVGNLIDAVAIVNAAGGPRQAVVRSGRSMTVLRDEGPAGVTDGISGFDTINLRAAGLSLQAPIVAAGAGSSVSLTATDASGIVQGSGGRVSAATLNVSAVSAGAPALLDLGGATDSSLFNAVQRLGTVAVGGAFHFAGAAALTLTSDIIAGGDLTIRAPGITQTGGTITSTGTGATILLSGDVITLDAGPPAGTATVVASGAGGFIGLQPFSPDTGIFWGAGTGFELTSLLLSRMRADGLSLRATGSGAVRIGAPLALGAAALDLRGASVTQDAGAPITAAAISGSATGAFLLTLSDNRFGAARNITAGGTLALVSDNALTIGGVSTTGASFSVTAPSITVDGALSAGGPGGGALLGLTATAGGIALGTAGVTAQGPGSAIELAATAAITQTTGGAGGLAAAELRLVDLGGTASAELRGSANAAGTLTSDLTGGLSFVNSTALTVGGPGITSAGGMVTLRAPSIAVNAPIAAAGNTVELTATGAGGITQGAGARITAARLNLASAGNALLDGGGATPAFADRNLIGTLGLLTVAGDATLRNAAGLTLDGLVSGDGAVARMGTLTLDTLGAITQTGGAIRAATLALVTDSLSTSGATLQRPDNDIGQLGGTLGGGLRVVTSGAITVGALAAGSLDIAAGGLLTLSGVIDAGDGGGNMALAGSGIAQSGGRLVAGTLTLATAGDATLANGDPALTTGLNQIGTLGTAEVGGALLLRNQGGFFVSQRVGGPGAASSSAISLHSQAGDILFTGLGALRGDALGLTAPNGRVALINALNAVNGITIAAGVIQLGGGLTNTTTGGIRLETGSLVTLSGNVAAPGQRVTILADGGVLQTGGGITAAELVVRGRAPDSGAAGIALGGANAIGSVVELRSSGDLRLRATGTLRIDGPVVAGANATLRLETSGQLRVNATGSVTAGDPALLEGGQVSLWGFGIRLEGPVRAGDGVTLIAAAGAMDFAGLPSTATPGATINQLPTGTITARRLATVAPDTVDLTGGLNAVDTIAHVGLGNTDLVITSSRPLLRIGSSPVVTSPAGETRVLNGIGGVVGNVTLTAAALEIAQPIFAGTGATVTFTSDQLAIDAVVSAPGGTVLIRPVTAGLDYALGTGAASAPGLVSLSAAQLANLRTGTLRFEGDAGTAFTLGSFDLRGGSPAARAARSLDLAGASVTQTAGGEVSVERITASLGGAFLLDQGGSRTATGNTINILGPITATAGDVVILAGGLPDNGNGRRAPALDGAGTPIGGTQSLQLAGAILAGGDLTLLADGLGLAGGSLTANGGTMTLGSFSPGVALLLGFSNTFFSNPQLPSALASAITIGGPAPRLNLLVPDGIILVAGAFDLGGIGGPQVLDMRAGAITSGSINGSTPSLTVPRLEMTATLGAADLSLGSHAVDSVLISAAPGAAAGLTSTRGLLVLGAEAGGARLGEVAFTAPSLTLDGPVRAAVLRLAATAPGGAITQSAPLDAGRLALTTLGGDVTLTDAANTIEWLSRADLRDATLTRGGALELRTASRLSLHNDGGVGIEAGDVDLRAAAFQPSAPGAPQVVTIRALGTPLGGGSIRLSGPSTSLSGSLDMDAGSHLIATARPAGSIRVDSSFRAAGSRIAASASVFINGLDGGVGLQDSIVTGTDISLLGAGGGTRVLAVAGGSLTATRSLSLSGGRDTVIAGTSLSGGAGLSVSGLVDRMTLTDVSLAGARLDLTGPDIRITRGIFESAGAVTVQGFGILERLTITDSRFAGGSISMRDSRLTMSGGSITTPGLLTLAATGGAMSVTGTSIAAGAATLGATSGPPLAPADLSLANAALTVAGPLSLSANGSIALGGTRVSSGALALNAGGGVQINPSSIDATSIAIAAGAGLTIRDSTLAASGAAGITAGAGPAGALAISNSTITAPVIAFAAGAAASLNGGSMTAGTDIAFGGLGGFAIASATLTAGGTIDVAGGGASRLGPATIQAERALFRTPASLALGPVTARIGSLLVFAGGAGITSTGPVTVSSLAPALRHPAIVFDSRAAAATSPLAQLVRPDIPGLPPGSQPTQMRSSPRSQAPGLFGPASDGAAGAIELALAAPDSPVFLLSDGGRIAGSIVAARLGVHGSGGGAVLDGVLGGRDGIAAAELADLTRPIAPGSLQQYRINGCVLSSVNCVVLPPVLVVPSRLAADVVVQLERQRLRNPDVIVPDVAQEEF